MTFVEQPKIFATKRMPDVSVRRMSMGIIVTNVEQIPIIWRRAILLAVPNVSALEILTDVSAPFMCSFKCLHSTKIGNFTT